jgi:tetratricopeptide (TPR) repeat protein
MSIVPRTLTTAAAVAGIALSGCATTPQELDPEALWRHAERQHADAIIAVAQRQQLQSDYAAVIRLSRDGDRRGQAFVRLAELDLALGDYDQARDNLEQSLHAGLTPEHRREALLMLGDLRERHLLDPDGAAAAYQQIINEHPATSEAELATLRLGRITP